MRVISGTAKGRRLSLHSGFEIRPTSDMVKESVFDIIQFHIEGRRVLDLFAGTGQLGIEALSRGAKSAVFVDSKPEAVKLVWGNLKTCGFEDRASVHTRDAIRYLGEAGTFDLIFLDPPFGSSIAALALQKIIEFDKLNPNGIIIVETKADGATPVVSPPYSLQKEYRYGSVKVARYERGAIDEYEDVQ